MEKNWRIVGRIATAFGALCIIFAAVAAIINYQFNTYFYGKTAPWGFIVVNILQAMLPYLLVAALSFAAAGIALRVPREEAKSQAEAAFPESHLADSVTQENPP